MTNYEKLCILAEKKTHDGLNGWEQALYGALSQYWESLSSGERVYWEDLPFDTDNKANMTFEQWWKKAAVDYDYLAFGSHFDKAIALSIWQAAVNSVDK